MSNLTYRHEIKKFKLVKVEDTSPVDESTEFYVLKVILLYFNRTCLLHFIFLSTVLAK